MSNNEKQPVCCRLKPGKSLQAILIPLLITVIVFIFGANKTIYLLENLIDSLTTSREVVESTTPMNVLILYADDWRFDTLGIESNSLVKTPFLDAFAEEGIRFTRNCVTTSVCWVSKSSS